MNTRAHHQRTLWWEEARRLDGLALERLLVVHPDRVEDARRLGRHETPDGWAVRVRLLALAREEDPEAARLYTEADAAYWKIALTAQDYIRSWAARQGQFGHDPDEAFAAVQMGAHRAAVQWVPERGSYTTILKHYLRASWQRANGRQADVQVPPHGGGWTSLRGLHTSLDAPRWEGEDMTIADSLPAEVDQDDEERALIARDAQQIRDLLPSLPEMERYVILERAEGLTLSEVGENLGLSRERIRQIQHNAQRKIIAMLANNAVKAASKTTPAPPAAPPKKEVPSGRPKIWEVPPAALQAVHNGETIRSVAETYKIPDGVLRTRYKQWQKQAADTDTTKLPSKLMITSGPAQVATPAPPVAEPPPPPAPPPPAPPAPPASEPAGSPPLELADVGGDPVDLLRRAALLLERAAEYRAKASSCAAAAKHIIAQVQGGLASSS